MVCVESILAIFHFTRNDVSKCMIINDHHVKVVNKDQFIKPDTFAWLNYNPDVIYLVVLNKCQLFGCHW